MSIDPHTASIEYAAHGIATFPLHNPTGTDCACSCPKRSACGQIGKHPIGGGWQEHASSDIIDVTDWRTRRPDHNVGVPTGRGFDVLDIDGEEAAELLDKLCRLNEVMLNDTPAARTGRGTHYFLAPTGHGNATGIWPGIDWRGIGGYIVAPPSLHANGNRYQWLDGRSIFDIPAPPAPRFLTDQLERRRRPDVLDDLDIYQQTGNASAALKEAMHTAWHPDSLTDVVKRASEGNRNAATHWAACRVVEAHALHRCSSNEANDALDHIRTAAIENGLDERSVTRTIDSARKTR